GLGQPRQRLQCARHPNAFAGGSWIEPHSPAQLEGAGAKAGVPAFSGVELADEIEEAGGRGVEVSRQLGDLVTQSVQCARVHGESPSAGATLHPSSFGAIGEARQAAIAGRSTVLRRTHPRWLLRVSV